MRKLSIPLMLLTVLIGTAVGSNTKVVTTWKDPNIGPPKFEKIAIAFPNRDQSLRERVENGLARRIRRAVAAHTFVLDSDLGDREALKKRLAANGVDGFVLLRLLNVDEDKVIAFGDSAYVYPSLWDSWADPMTVSTATYSYTRRVVTADLGIFSVASGKPVWVGRMKSTDAKYLKELLDDLVKAGTSELKKQKML